MRRPSPGRQSQCEGLTTEEESPFLMDTQNPSAPSHAHARVAGKKHSNRHPQAGLVHDNTRHTTRFTVIGNRLAQHPELSLLAIGLGVHIQSLPAGARVDIKSLAARFPEGTTRIAANHVPGLLTSWTKRVSRSWRRNPHTPGPCRQTCPKS